MPATATPNLVTLIKQGDQNAANEWFSKHQEQLNRWVRYGVVVRPGPFGSASDVLPNTVPEVLTGIPDDIQDDKQLLGWVHRRLRWRAIDLARTNDRNRMSPLAAGSCSESGCAGPEPSAPVTTSLSLQITRQEREEYILTRSGYPKSAPYNDVAADTLIVLLRQIGEIPLKVIAEWLDIGCVEVGRQYYKALQPLRVRLDQLRIGNWPPEQDDDRDKMFRALPALTDQQRKVVELCHLEQDAFPTYDGETGKYEPLNCQYSLREAGEVLDMTSGAVGQCVFRAVKRLGEILNPPTAS
jgi:DNA-directed RNA polymerase specialized sigma24 family protein